MKLGNPHIPDIGSGCGLRNPQIADKVSYQRLISIKGCNGAIASVGGDVWKNRYDGQPSGDVVVKYDDISTPESIRVETKQD
ncbi:hypothetical protein [Trichormus sp. NMC-1]|uniref:hypothetical protein n=1 Tax=Trichormus sp. NMC-1 TaxID=1853259 RepID=UPI0008DC004E|nr:hypothetical protein [Trichormus sp. NMC-1]